MPQNKISFKNFFLIAKANQTTSDQPRPYLIRGGTVVISAVWTQHSASHMVAAKLLLLPCKHERCHTKLSNIAANCRGPVQNYLNCLRFTS